MTYDLCKMIITNGDYEKSDMTQKLDVFLLNNRIDKNQYNELVGLMK